MSYQVLPFVKTPERHQIISDLMRKIALTPTLFDGTPCEEECVKAKALPEMCDLCKMRMIHISKMLSAPDTISWEVWSSEAELVGLVYATHVVPGHDALGHYVFFDERLGDKIDAIEEVISEMWTIVPRITIEIPAPFHTLVRHATRKLGFGGRYQYVGGLRVEGVKEASATWKGERVDLLVLGRSRPAPPQLVNDS